MGEPPFEETRRGLVFLGNPFVMWQYHLSVVPGPMVPGPRLTGPYG